MSLVLEIAKAIAVAATTPPPYLLVLEVHGGVLHRGVHAAEPGGLRGGRDTLGSGLARRIHQLPVRVCRVEGREASGQVFADAHLRAFDVLRKQTLDKVTGHKIGEQELTGNR